MNQDIEYCGEVASWIINNIEVIKATKFVSPTHVIRAVRKTYKSDNRKPSKAENIQIILTIGKPNYIERDFIALCKKAKSTFPLKHIQLKNVNPNYKKLYGNKKKK